MTATTAPPPVRIPLYVPQVGPAEHDNLSDCLRSGLLIHGPWVTAFERRIADYVGTAFAVGTNSGTSALHTALLLAGVQPGDRVLLTTMTFIAPANAVRYVGAEPVFVDVDPASLQMDVGAVADYLRDGCVVREGRAFDRQTGQRVSAIVAVHFLGIPVDLDPLLAVARASGVVVIEDAAQALGTEYRGRRVGSLGVLGCFSFHGNKLITAGGGGMIVTSDESLARRARYLVNQAKDDPVETAHHAVGFNYRMTNLHGAIGCAQFDRIATHIARKRAIAARYAEAFADVPGLSMMAEPAGTFYTFWLSTVLVDEARFGSGSRALMRQLREQGIESLPLYQPLHLSPAHPGSPILSGGGVAERLAATALTLPSSVGLGDAELQQVIDAVVAAAGVRPTC